MPFVTGCTIQGARTSMYSALFDSKGECLLGLGDMEIHNQITPELVSLISNVNIFMYRY